MPKLDTRTPIIDNLIVMAYSGVQDGTKEFSTPNRNALSAGAGPRSSLRALQKFFGPGGFGG